MGQDSLQSKRPAAISGPGGYDNTWVVGDSIWQLRFARKLPDNAAGLCDPSTHTMYIRYKQGRIETWRTFLHEVFHAIEDEYGMEIEHDLIHKLEAMLGDFIIENSPAICKILFP